MSGLKELFCVSDIHGYFSLMKEALDKAGFDPTNENHWLICCGDYFDRGSEPAEVMQYLMSLERVVLVRGNHEDLFDDACERQFPFDIDFSNGTYDTICKLGEATQYWESCLNAYNMTRDFFGKMVNYFETKNYIFVHGWVPLDDNWRDADKLSWDEARWYNGMAFCASDGPVEDKTTICGHWHTSWGHSTLEERGSEWGDGADFSPYYNKGIIAIDGCTAASGIVNVVHLVDEFIE